MKVKIAHLYYDLMNLYGEQGNIIALKESLKNQNIETEIDLLSIGDDINFKDYDIFYIGTGSKESLLLTLEDIKKYTKDIKSAIKGGKVFISTGNSHELFGKSLTYKIKIKGASGKQIKIGLSMGLSNSNLTLPNESIAFSLLSDPAGAETLVAKANPEDLDYNSATANQKNQMWTFSHEKTEQLGATTDYRYIGTNPNNYVEFNDELWRIIGVFDTDDGTGKMEKRLKIIRNESIGDYAWDNKNTSTGAEDYYGKNNWPDARLNYLLNSDHDSETYGGSLYWNRKSGTCYSGFDNETSSCDFTNIGLKDTSKQMISDAKWYLGSTTDYRNTSNGLVTHFYKYERGTTVYKSSIDAINWTGKVGLIYPSDYGYATSGDSSTTRATCFAKELYNWDDLSACYKNDWLFKSSNMWPILPSASGSGYVFIANFRGSINDNDAASPRGVYPVVYLKSTINITSGTGSSTDPFILSLT